MRRLHSHASIPLLAAAVALVVWLRPSPSVLAAPLQAIAAGPVNPAPTQAVGADPVRRSRRVAVTLAGMPTPATSAGAFGDQRSSIRLDLFDDVSVTAVFDRFDSGTGNTTWVGHVEGVPGSTVTLVYDNDVMTGSVLMGEATYVIRPASADERAATPLAVGTLHVVEDIDQSGFRPEGPMIEVVLPPVAADASGVEVMGDGADLIDVMVVYTPAAVGYTGSVAAMHNQIGIAISQTNTAYANSGVIQRLRLVHASQVPYAESGNASTDLSNLRTGAGGLSDVATLRNTYGADVVALVQYDPGSPYCGIGYLMSAPNSSFAGYAFSVTEVDCITNHTFAHELGHNMGLRHDWHMDSAVTPYTYAHGHVNTGAAGNRWRTIMSYNNLCSALGYSCTRLLAWSNPTLTHNGAPTGIAAGTKATCMPGSTTSNTCDADERLALDYTAPIVANFRQSVSSVPGTFAKTSPSNGASSQPASVTLAWQASAGATSYEYCLDTAVDGACGGAWTSTGTSLSTVVDGLSAASTYEWQVRAVSVAGSTSANGGSAWTFSVGPSAGANLLTNGTFGSGATAWQTFATPSASYIVSNVSGGVLQFYRVSPPTGTTNQAVVFQQTGMPMASGAPVRLEVSLGNSDAVRKRMTVLVHDADFSDLAACTFWLPANTPLTTYAMQTHTTRAWSNATVSFYGSSPGSGGYYRVDDVTLQYEPAQSATSTICVDPFAPDTAAEGDSPDLLINGGFTNGISLAPWTLYGQINSRIANGVFEFVRPEGAPAGVVLQRTGQSLAAGATVTSTFQLGNSSGSRKRVTMLLHDSDFSDLTVCTFWLAPGQPLSNYMMRGFASKAWNSATVSVYPSTVDLDTWARLDSVTLRATPGTPTIGTECHELGVSPDAALDGGVAPASEDSDSWLSSEDEDSQSSGQLSAVSLHADAGWISDGFDRKDDRWRATVDGFERSTLTRVVPLDLTESGDGRVSFESWLSGAGASARLEVSVDGDTWVTAHIVEPSDTWLPVEADLDASHGSRLYVRFILEASADAVATWSIRPMFGTAFAPGDQ